MLRLRLDDGNGRSRWITADLLDYSRTGVGIALALPIAVGTVITINGKLVDGDDRSSSEARVAWCLEKHDGSFRVGLEFEDDAHNDEAWQKPEPPPEEAEIEEDYYEVLQLSPNALPDTIHRVYRMLAQRLHPDNSETGNEEEFKRVLAAYRVLNDPEQRAAYDAKRFVVRKARWRIFDQQESARGIAAEKRKREGILCLLYTARVNDPDHPGMSIHEVEDLLGCPRDHLQVSLWYLKEKGYLRRDDRGRYYVTAEGVDQIEQLDATSVDLRGLIEAPNPQSAVTS